MTISILKAFEKCHLEKYWRDPDWLVAPLGFGPPNLWGIANSISLRKKYSRLYTSGAIKEVAGTPLFSAQPLSWKKVSPTVCRNLLADLEYVIDKQVLDEGELTRLTEEQIDIEDFVEEYTNTVKRKYHVDFSCTDPDEVYEFIRLSERDNGNIEVYPYFDEVCLDIYDVAPLKQLTSLKYLLICSRCGGFNPKCLNPPPVIYPSRSDQCARKLQRQLQGGQITQKEVQARLRVNLKDWHFKA